MGFSVPEKTLKDGIVGVRGSAEMVLAGGNR